MNIVLKPTGSPIRSLIAKEVILTAHTAFAKTTEGLVVVGVLKSMTSITSDTWLVNFSRALPTMYISYGTMESKRVEYTACFDYVRGNLSNQQSYFGNHSCKYQSSNAEIVNGSTSSTRGRHVAKYVP